MSLLPAHGWWTDIKSFDKNDFEGMRNLNNVSALFDYCHVPSSQALEAVSMYNQHQKHTSTSMTMALGPKLLQFAPRSRAIRPSITITSLRSFHASPSIHSSKPSSSRDTRLQGRRRFYKYVGTTPVEAPWETPFDPPVEATIESPISAGVDGTQSASGVAIEMPTMEDLQKMLQPRNPDTTEKIPCHWFGVTLDGKSIKTPLGKQLAVPSQFLAWAIAAEWDAQSTILQPAQMPLMTLCCTAMDQVAGNPQLYKDLSLRYLPTDTTCFWTDPGEDRVLHRKQQQAWQGLHDYCESLLEGRPAVAMGASEGLIMSRRRDNKEFGLPHPPVLIEKAQEWVNSLDAWHLCALHSVASESKSFLVAMAVILSLDESNPYYYLKKAVAASRVEEEFQIEIWGLVEGGHDYDRLNCAIQIHSAQVLASSIAVGNRFV